MRNSVWLHAEQRDLNCYRQKMHLWINWWNLCKFSRRNYSDIIIDRSICRIFLFNFSLASTYIRYKATMLSHEYEMTMIFNVRCDKIWKWWNIQKLISSLHRNNEEICSISLMILFPNHLWMQLTKWK